MAICFGITGYGNNDPGTLVYPVQVKVTITIDRSPNPPTVTERGGGVEKGDTFFFYKDDFGNWTFKTGRM